MNLLKELMRTMVNETRIYSSLQNLPFTTLFGTYASQATTGQVFATIPAGHYEIRVSGIMLANADTGERRIGIGSGIPLLAWSNSTNAPDISHKETTIEVDLPDGGSIRGDKIGTPDAPPVAYQIAYRTTPSLDLITSADLYKKNQGLEAYFEKQQQLQLQDKKNA